MLRIRSKESINLDCGTVMGEDRLQQGEWDVMGQRYG